MAISKLDILFSECDSNIKLFQANAVSVTSNLKKNYEV